MATRVILDISIKGQQEGSGEVLLADDFDTVYEKIAPVQSPSSALEDRRTIVHNGIGGRRVLIMPQHVVVVEENAEVDE